MTDPKKKYPFFSALYAGLRTFIDAPFWLMALVALAALAARAPQQLLVASWQNILVYGLGHAVLYRALYWLIAQRFSPWKMALLWLGSPLLIFSATWLRPVWAVVFTIVWAAALWWSICQQSSDEENQKENKKNGVAGYLILLAWVSLCGAGGYGYQTSDYVMHNGRLLDLIHYAWPVSYASADGSHQLLVQYAGYYLWPALAGKLAGEPVAMLVQHLWLLAGCWLALRMLVVLTGVWPWLAAAGLVLFGGWDIVGFSLYAAYGNSDTLAQLDPPSIQQLVLTCLGAPGMLDFWPAVWVVPGQVWFGNFISLAASLSWSPHQVVAGWLVVGLLCRGCYQQKIIASLFACALLAYYAPMIALGMSPMVLLLAVHQLASNGWHSRDILSPLAGISVLCVLGAYYASVPAGRQPFGVLPVLSADIFVLLLFLLQSWMLYALFVVLHRQWLDRKMMVFIGAVFTMAVILPCVHYGVYNDFMVRSSSAVYYGMLIVMLALLRTLWLTGAYWRTFLLVILLLPGMFSGVSNVLLSALHADVSVPGKSVADYLGGWQFMGQQDSWFVRHLSADLQATK